MCVELARIGSGSLTALGACSPSCKLVRRVLRLRLRLRLVLVLVLVLVFVLVLEVPHARISIIALAAL